MTREQRIDIVDKRLSLSGRGAIIRAVEISQTLGKPMVTIETLFLGVIADPKLAVLRSSLVSQERVIQNAARGAVYPQVSNGHKHPLVDCEVDELIDHAQSLARQRGHRKAGSPELLAFLSRHEVIQDTLLLPGSVARMDALMRAAFMTDDAGLEKVG